MLILNRRIGETIVINGDIRITVLSIERQRTARLCIAKPKNIETYQKTIRRSNRSAKH
ncbi:carbon storage regulator [Pseudomonas sp. NPDC098747]|uniref:carbon storage regulator n=1 Tax=Pseudomonas sp. NPDC098747 TaxID=3364487 RepID=UPI003839D6A8